MKLPGESESNSYFTGLEWFWQQQWTFVWLHWLCCYLMNEFGSVAFRNTYPEIDAGKVSAGRACLSVPKTRGELRVRSGASHSGSTASQAEGYNPMPPRLAPGHTYFMLTQTGWLLGLLSAFPEGLPSLWSPFIPIWAEQHSLPLPGFLPLLRSYRVVLNWNVRSVFWLHVADLFHFFFFWLGKCGPQ